MSKIKGWEKQKDDGYFKRWYEHTPSGITISIGRLPTRNVNNWRVFMPASRKDFRTLKEAIKYRSKYMREYSVRYMRRHKLS